MKYLLIVITLLLFLFVPATISSAQQNSSDGSSTFTTCIKGKPCNPAGGESNNSLVKAAQDLHDAYIACSNGTGKTTVTDALSGCLHDQLAKKGYPEKNITQTVSPLVIYEAQGCIQCIGYVRQALILAYGAPSSLEGNAGDNFFSPTITVGSHTFKNLGSVPAQAGDIAVASGASDSCKSSEQICGAGHILIVKQGQGNIKFIALESNWSYINGVLYQEPHCVVTDFVAHPVNVYHIFREQ